MALKGMKGLLAWCKKNTQGYKDVDVINMSSSWKDGLAFCALLHKFHPELIDFDALSKENVLYNNQLAFSVAEQLGIAPFLDPEDMANMRVPDKLSIVTYLSQYYSYFKDCKPIEPGAHCAVSNTLKQTDIVESAKKSGDDSACSICGRKVHLVQRYMEDGKLYHRTCLRDSSLDYIRGQNYSVGRKSTEQTGSDEHYPVTASSSDAQTPPDPGMEKLPIAGKFDKNTGKADAYEIAPDSEYDNSLNPFELYSKDENTLSSMSPADDKNPFTPVTVKQESESENEGNPFGDDDIDEVVNEGSMNPFAEYDTMPSPPKVSPWQSDRFNPFSTREEREEDTKISKAPEPGFGKKVPPRPPPLQKPPQRSYKKAPAPLPPTSGRIMSKKADKFNEDEGSINISQNKAIGAKERSLSPSNPPQKMDRFKLRRISTPKSRIAPGYGHPLVKRKVNITMTEEEITTELKVLDIKLTDYETKGVKLEEMLRYAMNKDVEWTKEEDELLNEWFELVNKKNILLRDESDLVFQLQQQKLEQEHADVEFELRKLLNKPHFSKSPQDKESEEELLQKLVEIVERRNVIINSIEEERVKEAEEDSMHEQMKWVRNHTSTKKKNRVKKIFSKKDKKGTASNS